MTTRASSNPSRAPTLDDYKALWIPRLAKLRRRRFDTDSAGYERFYEAYFEERGADAHIEDRRMVLRREVINGALARHTTPGSRLIDCGCGLGDVLHGIPASLGLILHGFDFAAADVRVASRRLGARAVIRQGSIHQIPFDAGTMDAAICLEVLEHIEDGARAVREIARVLRPGGVFIGAVPYTYWWPDYQRLMGHFRHYTRESFSALLRSAGLEPVEHLPNFPNWARAYTQKYPWVRAKQMAFGRFFGSKDLYHFRRPWSARASMDKVVDRLKPLEDAERALDYSTLDTSTFILARKASDAGQSASGISRQTPAGRF